MQTKRKTRQKKNLTIGKAEFKDKINMKKLKNIIKRNHRKILQQEQWIIDNDNCKECQWVLILKWIQRSNCQKIILKRYDSQNMLKCLNWPIFDKLISLQLENNNILNVQSLSFVNAQNIQTLKISDNNLSLSKSLTKLRWKKLKHLDYSLNYFHQIQLSRIKINSQIKLIICQQIQSEDRSNQDLSIFAKLQTQITKERISMRNMNRIKQFNTLYSLNKKFIMSKIQIYGPSVEYLVRLRRIFDNVDSSQSISQSEYDQSFSQQSD